MVPGRGRGGAGHGRLYPHQFPCPCSSGRRLFGPPCLSLQPVGLGRPERRARVAGVLRGIPLVPLGGPARPKGRRRNHSMIPHPVHWTHPSPHPLPAGMRLLACTALAALALVLLAAHGAAAATAAAASTEHGRHYCRRGESWCDNRCCPSSFYLSHRHHCGRVRRALFVLTAIQRWPSTSLCLDPGLPGAPRRPPPPTAPALHRLSRYAVRQALPGQPGLRAGALPVPTRHLVVRPPVPRRRLLHHPPELRALRQLLPSQPDLQGGWAHAASWVIEQARSPPCSFGGHSPEPPAC